MYYTSELDEGPRGLTFLLQVGIALAQIVLGFYGFWLAWRVLLPLLPGPREPSERIAPFAGYFTDPLIRPLAKGMRLHPNLASALLLVAVAASQAGIAQLPRVS